MLDYFALWHGSPWLVCIFSLPYTCLFLRVIRGGNGLVDGPVIPGNLEKAMKKIADEGFAHKQQVHANWPYLVWYCLLHCEPVIIIHVCQPGHWMRWGIKLKNGKGKATIFYVDKKLINFRLTMLLFYPPSLHQLLECPNLHSSTYTVCVWPIYSMHGSSSPLLARQPCPTPFEFLISWFTVILQLHTFSRLFVIYWHVPVSHFLLSHILYFVIPALYTVPFFHSGL